jgi:hypothetical protein
MRPAIVIHKLAYNRRTDMAWSRKDTRDDINHPKPVKLPPNGWAQPEQRAVAAVHEALRNESDEEFNRRAAEFDAKYPDPNREPVSLTKFEEAMNEDRIANIKGIVSKLTYGEMVELCEQLGQFLPDIGNSEAMLAVKLALPSTVHRWAISEVHK